MDSPTLSPKNTSSTKVANTQVHSSGIFLETKMETGKAGIFNSDYVEK